MHSTPNVNVRAARALVRTVTATREQTLAAIGVAERDIARQGRAVRRARTSRWMHPGVAVVLLVVASLAGNWFAYTSGLLHVGSRASLLASFAVIAVTAIVTVLVAENAEVRYERAAVHLNHLHDRAENIRTLARTQGITVAESEDVLRRVEATA